MVWPTVSTAGAERMTIFITGREKYFAANCARKKSAKLFNGE
jgi:hypothetical protein